jgi:hypothetical protein
MHLRLGAYYLVAICLGLAGCGSKSSGHIQGGAGGGSSLMSGGGQSGTSGAIGGTGGSMTILGSATGGGSAGQGGSSSGNGGSTGGFANDAGGSDAQGSTSDASSAETPSVRGRLVRWFCRRCPLLQRLRPCADLRQMPHERRLQIRQRPLPPSRRDGCLSHPALHGALPSPSLHQQQGLHHRSWRHLCELRHRLLPTLRRLAMPVSAATAAAVHEEPG